MSDVHLLNLSDNKHYPYQIVHSKRAKYVRIKLSNRGELTVVLPKGTPAKFAHNFVKNKAFWVEKNLRQITIPDKKQAPELLDLKLLGESWNLEYQTTDESSETLVLIELPEFRLRITGNVEAINNTDVLSKTINQWCKKKAHQIFKQMLEQLAEEQGFHYQRLSIRAQKTRWGSCSNKKNINLNCKLLFMPEEIVKYVMIHELCHTIEMNHSKRFWLLVEDCDPDYQYHRKELRQLGKNIPL